MFEIRSTIPFLLIQKVQIHHCFVAFTVKTAKRFRNTFHTGRESIHDEVHDGHSTEMYT